MQGRDQTPKFGAVKRINVGFPYQHNIPALLAKRMVSLAAPLAVQLRELGTTEVVIYHG